MRLVRAPTDSKAKSNAKTYIYLLSSPICCYLQPRGYGKSFLVSVLFSELINFSFFVVLCVSPCVRVRMCLSVDFVSLCALLAGARASQPHRRLRAVRTRRGRIARLRGTARSALGCNGTATGLAIIEVCSSPLYLFLFCVCMCVICTLVCISV